MKAFASRLRSIPLLIWLGCQACTGPSFHVEVHRDQVPDAVRARATENCAVFSSPDFLSGALYLGVDQVPPPYPPVVTRDYRFADDRPEGHEFHVVILGLGSDGSVLYRGEDTKTVTDGVTFVVVCSPTGSP